MQEHFAEWQDDLPQVSGWPAFFDDCDNLDFQVIPEILQIEDVTFVWPGRRENPLPNAPDGVHICRAFEGIEPADARVVVLGQDPYRSVTEATGRAFEDGSWRGERTEELARSCPRKGEHLTPHAALTTSNGRADLFRPGSWLEIRRQIRDRDLVLPALNNYFNALAGQGVLFVNTAWTRTGDDHLRCGSRLWKPVVDCMLRKLARSNQHVVFLILGGDAREALCAADPICHCSAIVDSAHPVGYASHHPAGEKSARRSVARQRQAHLRKGVR